RRAHWAILTAFGLGLGCGGGANTASPPAAPASSAPSPAADAPAAPTASSPPSTTTTAVADAGGAPGTKLVEATTPPADSAGAAPKGHTHDPGRGTDDIRAIVVAHRDEARACYDHALLTHPGIEGDIVFTWKIDPKGAVTNVALDQAKSKIT